MKYISLVLIVIFCISCTSTFNEKEVYQKRFKGFEHILSKGVVQLAVTGNTRKIDIPDKDSDFINLDTLINDIYYVRLQTTKSSLIGKIDKIIFTDDYILIADKNVSQSIFIFDQHGNFSAKISGDPDSSNALLHITDIAFDTEKKRVLVYDDESNKIMYFNLQGKYVGYDKVFLQLSHIGSFPDQSMIFELEKNSNYHIPEIAKYNVVLGTPALLSGKALEQNIQSVPANRGSITNFNVLQDKILYTPNFSDTIYEISLNTILSKYYIHLGKRNIKNALDTKTNAANFLKILATGSYSYFKGFCTETPTTLYFEVQKKGNLHYFYHKKSNKLIGGMGYAHSNANPNIKFFAYPFTSFRDHFVGIIQPEAITQQLKTDSSQHEQQPGNGLFSKVAATDNPILVFYNIK
jgi:6-bladed beta-propeller